jgi:hypothetical protein
VRQQVAADGLEPFALDLDVEPLRHLVDVHLAAEHEPAAPSSTIGSDSTSYSSRISPTISSSSPRSSPARGAPVLVDDDRDLRLLALELLQELGHALGLVGTTTGGRSSGVIGRVVVGRRERTRSFTKMNPAMLSGCPCNTGNASILLANSARTSPIVAFADATMSGRGVMTSRPACRRSRRCSAAAAALALDDPSCSAVSM